MLSNIIHFLICADSDQSGIISKIIKSKVKLYSALNKVKDDNSGAVPALSSRSSYDSARDDEVEDFDINVPVSDTEMLAAMDSFHVFQKPIPEMSTVELPPPIAFVPAGSQQLQLPSTWLQLPPPSLQPPSSESFQISSALGVRRSRKSKKKNKKRSVAHAQ